MISQHYVLKKRGVANKNRNKTPACLLYFNIWSQKIHVDTHFSVWPYE